MGVSFEPIAGFLARLGPHHRKYGDPYTATVMIVPTGGKTAVLKGFSGQVGTRLITEGLRAVKSRLGLTALSWERKRKDRIMAKFEATIVMEYHEEGSQKPKARASLEYFDMDQEHIDRLEGGVFGGLLSLRRTAE